MRSRLFGTVGALVLGATGLFVGATATPAAASCSHGHSFRDGTGGYVSATDAAVRPGPHVTCGGSNPPRAYNGYAVQYHCYTLNGDYYNGVNTWTWGYVPALRREGWINDALLYNRGSSELC